MSETYKVEGMTCGGCVRSVTNAITRLAPNATVAVDLPTGLVTVDGADAETVRNAVEGAGFDFGGAAG